MTIIPPLLPIAEEEWKRLQSLAGDSGRYNQIGFSYGSASAAGGGAAAPESTAAAAAATPAVDDEPYQPPTALNVPDDMAQVRRGWRAAAGVRSCRR